MELKFVSSYKAIATTVTQLKKFIVFIVIYKNL